MSEPFIISLFVLAISALVCLGGVWALLKDKVVVDGEGNVVTTEIDIPLFGKIKSGIPSLVALFVGAVLAVWTLNKEMFEVRQIPLEAKVGVNGFAPTSGILVGAVPHRYFRHSNVNGEGVATVRMSVDEADTYNVIAFAISSATPENGTSFEVSHGLADLDEDAKKWIFDTQLGR